MKNFLLALTVVLTAYTLAVIQTTVVRDSIGKIKIIVTRNNKTNTNNTAVTVIGADTAGAGSADVNVNSSDISTTHGRASFTFDSDDNDFPFHNVSAGGSILVAVVAIIAVFEFPVFTLFVIFFFRYKNRRIRYRLTEQVLAVDQSLPAELIRENKTVGSRSQGIKNTLMGIGLFIFLWAIIDEFGIGTIGLLITFMGTGQWIIGSKQQTQDAGTTWIRTGNKDEKKNPNNVRTDNFETIPSESEEKDRGVNEEKNDENR